MVKAFFLDFYGTIVHEDGEVIKKITQIIMETGKADNTSEIAAFWWKAFQDLFTNSHGVRYTQVNKSVFVRNKEHEECSE